MIDRAITWTNTVITTKFKIKRSVRSVLTQTIGRLYEYILTVGGFFISSAVGLLIGAFLGVPFFFSVENDHHQLDAI